MMELHVCNRRGNILKAFALGDNNEVLVGRDESCDVRIQAASISREHCCIEQDGERMVLRDLNSTGGTFLAGKKIDRVRLADGMEISVGPAILKFYDTGL